jgi:hypothetical protein
MEWPHQYDDVLIADNTSYFNEYLDTIESEPVHPEPGNASLWPDLYGMMGDQKQILWDFHASPARAEDIALPPAWYGTQSAAGTFTPSSTNLVTC